MKFVNISDDYKVNLDAIFSIERRIIPNREECENYNAKLEQISEEITANPPWLECNGETYNPVHDTNAKENPLYEIYSQELKKYLYSQIGEQPPLYKYEYYIIMSTGVKLQISQTKYDAIIECINRNQKEVMK